MPVFKQHSIFDIARDVRAFLSLEAGIVRARTPEKSGSGRNGKSGGRNLAQARRRIEQQRQRIEKQEQELAELRARASRGGIECGLRPENIVWMFSDGRSGSTWLTSMMEDINGYGAWREPNVGTLFGNFYYHWSNEMQRGTGKFILGSNRESWVNSIRSFVLSEARSRFPNLSENEYLVVKEPFGSLGAPLLMEALPESRMIFLIRDPRDVVASAMDANRKGGVFHQRHNAAQSEAGLLSEGNTNTYVSERAKRYLLHVGNSREAYEAHRGTKALLYYEDLRANTLEEMKRLYSDLSLSFDEEKLACVVERRSYENLPAEKKGEGKFARKATPGGWREDLTPEQARIVEEITAPLLEEFYAD